MVTTPTTDAAIVEATIERPGAVDASIVRQLAMQRGAFTSYNGVLFVLSIKRHAASDWEIVGASQTIEFG